MRTTLVMCAFLAIMQATLGTRAYGQPRPETSQQPFELRAGAWDRSVQLERDGKLQEARAVLMRAWAPTESYEVTVRTAWLSLRMGRYQDAEAAYRIARTLGGAGPEATQGHASALAGLGFLRLEESSPDEAGMLFRQALALDPTNEPAKAGLARIASTPVIEPELWGAYVRMPDDGPAWNGWAVFAQLPWRVTSALTLRAAFRHVELQREVPALSASGQGSRGARGRDSQTWRQNEVFAGTSYDKPWWGLGVLAIGLFASSADPAWGGAVRGRLGRIWGLNVDASAIRMGDPWNGQLMPTLFVWPTRHLGFAAGSRITWDPEGTLGNAYAGASVRLTRLALHVSGHAGPEHWPVTMTVPSVLTIDHKTPYGGTLAAVFSVTDVVRIGVQTQLERVSLAGTDGNYFTVSGGVQLAPSF